MSYIEIAIVVGLLFLVFWRQDTFLFLISSVVLIAAGLKWYDAYSTSTGFIFAAGLALLGLYCLARGVHGAMQGKVF